MYAEAPLPSQQGRGQVAR